MKRIIKLLIFIIVLILVYYIYNQKQTKKINYVSIGDGLSVGFNSYQEPSYGYTNYLKDHLKSKKLLNKYNDFSYEEMTITDLKKDILINVHDNNGQSIREALREANLLTLSIGINDLIYKINTNYIYNSKKMEKISTKIVNNFDTSIKELKKYYKRKIYYIGYYNFYPQNSVERKQLDRLNNKIKKMCKENDIIYIDNSNITKNITNYLENKNSFYPNITGYEQIFNNIYKNIDI